MSTSASILVVEDDFGARTIVKTILSGKGYAVTDCANGNEALEILKTSIFDLIVLDLMMPGLSGYDVVVHLKQRPETQNIPVIMLTAKSESTDVLRGYRDFGCDYYITKPFTSAQLIQGIELVLSQDEKPVYSIDDPDDPDDENNTESA